MTQTKKRFITKPRLLFRLMKYAGVTILVAAVALILVAEYRSYVEKVAMSNSGSSRYITHPASPNNIGI